MRTPLLAVDSVIFFEGGVVLIREEESTVSRLLCSSRWVCGDRREHRRGCCQRGPGGDQPLIDLVGLVGVYSAPHRDPRGHVVSVCYFSKGSGNLVSGSTLNRPGSFRLTTCLCLLSIMTK